MDDLDTLPVDEETEIDEEQSEQLRSVVGAPADAGGSGKSSKKSKGWFDGAKWKIIGIVAVIFAILANPFMKGMVSKIPYVGGSDWTQFGFIATVFTIALILVVLFV
jgi:hypothetical protein